MRSRTLYRLNGLLIALHVAGAAALLPRLPRQIPIHFGLGGEPDWWVETSVAAWFLLPVVAVATALMLRGLGRLASRSPELWNLPEKERFLRLSREDREPIEETLRAYLAWTSILVTLVFVALHLGVYTTAVGRTDGLPRYVIGFTVAAFSGILIGAVVLYPRLKRQILEATEAASAGGGEVGG